MSAIEEEVSSESGATSKGPGERLQAARIEQGLTIDDVANRMHLSIGILEALEENNFDEITAPIFVKGYLRAYARIVALDEEEMIGLYAEYHRGEDPPISTITNVGSELSVTDARIRWTTYLVILVLLTLLGAWWWNRQDVESVPISLDSQSEAESAADLADSAPVIEAISESLEPPSVVEAPMVPAPEFIDGNDADDSSGLEIVELADAGETMAEPEIASGAESAPTPTQDDPVVVAAPAPNDPVLAEAPGQANLSESAPQAVADASETPAASRRLTPVIAPSGAQRLALVVHADTWADIKDGSGFRLVYDLLRAGSSVELTGEAPFAVFLGNGHGVEVQFNGNDYDISADVRPNNTARLSIGE